MAIDHKDPDGDSTMTSSIDSIRPDEHSRSGARTPTGNTPNSQSGVNASELSPPGSQTQKGPSASTSATRTLETRTGQAGEKNAEPTLGAWKSKRALEDYQRAMEFIVDKDFKLDEFGDPFDESDLHTKP